MAFLNGYALLQRMVTKDSSRADQPDGESVRPLRGRPNALGGNGLLANRWLTKVGVGVASTPQLRRGPGNNE